MYMYMYKGIEARDFSTFTFFSLGEQIKIFDRAPLQAQSEIKNYQKINVRDNTAMTNGEGILWTKELINPNPKCRLF
jgi:hypothetical protein